MDSIKNNSVCTLAKAERTRICKEFEESPASQGKLGYLAYIRDDKDLTYKERCLAKCFECCCGYIDGKVDCEVPSCALYPIMPYRGVHSSVMAEAL